MYRLSWYVSRSDWNALHLFSLIVDWDYCTTCYQDSRNAHNQDHRFAVLPFPAPRFVVNRLLECFRGAAYADIIAEWIRLTQVESMHANVETPVTDLEMPEQPNGS